MCRREGRESEGEWEAHVVIPHTSIWTDCRLGTS